MRIQPPAGVLGASAVEGLDDVVGRGKEAPPLMHFLANGRADVGGRVTPIVGNGDQLRAGIAAVWWRRKVVPGRLQARSSGNRISGRIQRR